MGEARERGLRNIYFFSVGQEESTFFPMMGEKLELIDCTSSASFVVKLFEDLELRTRI